VKSHTAAQASYLRNFTFGVEDSLASTVGLLSGVASAKVDTQTVILTGVVLVFTEAMSMAVGTFLSDQSVEEYEHHRDLPLRRSLPSAVIMFFSYLIAGVFPIIPYAVTTFPSALYYSVAAAIAALMLLGLFNASVSGTSVPRSIIRMAILGGSVAVAGILIGRLLQVFTAPV